MSSANEFFPKQVCIFAIDLTYKLCVLRAKFFDFNMLLLKE